MISVDEAFSILNKATFSPQEVEVSLRDAHSFILAETLISPISMPPFRQANMDGFALSLHDELTYDIVGEIKAGDFFDGQLQSGEWPGALCVRAPGFRARGLRSHRGRHTNRLG